MVRFSLVFLLLFLSACRSKPEVMPSDVKQSSAIVIQISDPMTNTNFWLLKLDPKKKKYSELQMFQSNFLSGKRMYLLNIEPGDYVLVGSYRYKKSNGQDGDGNVRYYHILDRESVEKTKFTVKPNQTYIVGEFSLDEKIQRVGADPEIDDIGEKVYPGFKDSLTKKIVLGIGFAILGIDLSLPAFVKVSDWNEKEELKAEIEKEVKLDFERTDWETIPIVKVQTVEKTKSKNDK
ncbi:MAG: hypothetical protein SFU98_10790 [Leptospiraceae bacterium]|nr:hypothetical protein [Leptospiraceae bacterium]